MMHLKLKEKESSLLSKNSIFNAEGLGEDIIEKIGISDCSHLKMCLGDIVLKGDYLNLTKIEIEILRLMGKKES